MKISVFPVLKVQLFGDWCELSTFSKPSMYESVQKKVFVEWISFP